MPPRAKLKAMTSDVFHGGAIYRAGQAGRVFGLLAGAGAAPGAGTTVAGRIPVPAEPASY